MHIAKMSFGEYIKLKDRTESDRNIVEKGAYCGIINRICDLVKYYEANRVDRFSIYTYCYYIGYMEGKRAERQRRNKSKEIACNE